MTTRSIVCGVICVALAAAAFFPGRQVDASSQTTAWIALLTTSGVVMAVSGVWVGMVFPDALRAILEGRKGTSDPIQLTMAEHLQATLAMSGIVLIASLIAIPVIAAVRPVDMTHEAVEVLRGVGFAAFVAATVVQIFALLMVLALGDEIRAEHKRRAVSPPSPVTQDVVKAKMGNRYPAKADQAKARDAAAAP